MGTYARPWKYCDACSCPVFRGDECKGCEVIDRCGAMARMHARERKEADLEHALLSVVFLVGWIFHIALAPFVFLAWIAQGVCKMASEGEWDPLMEIK